MTTPNKSDSIRNYVRTNFVEPARKRGEQRVRVIAGEVHNGLRLRNRMPMVCNAMRSKSLLSSARLRIVSDEGPPSGLGSTVAITYEIVSENEGSGRSHRRSQAESTSLRYGAFRRLRGIAKKAFESLGGGEKFIRKEREHFFGKE